MTYTPEAFWEKACEYFDWCVKNPLIETKAFGSGATANIPHPRPFTETGLKLFANISQGTWSTYCKGEGNYQGFLTVTKQIKEIIYTQKFEGAATGFFNSQIIARDLGLVDKIQHQGDPENPIVANVKWIGE